MPAAIRVLIIDDHTLIREGLASILRAEPDLAVVGLAGTVSEAVELALRLAPDVILMDFSLPDGTGVEATRLILSRHPQCKIIFLTVSDSDDVLFAAIRSGAQGYLLKNLQPAKLVAALRAVQAGESALSRSMTLRVMKEFSKTEPPASSGTGSLRRLSLREIQVLRELALGHTNQEIATRLSVSENTIKAHVHSILEKLDLDDRRAAARYARARGLGPSA
jgi:two-component system NarL family response regulator